MLAPSPRYEPFWKRFEFWFVASAFLLVTINLAPFADHFGLYVPPLLMAALGIQGSILAVGMGAIGFVLLFGRTRLIRPIVVLVALAFFASIPAALGYVRLVVELHESFTGFPF